MIILNLKRLLLSVVALYVLLGLFCFLCEIPFDRHYAIYLGLSVFVALEITVYENFVKSFSIYFAILASALSLVWLKIITGNIVNSNDVFIYFLFSVGATGLICRFSFFLLPVFFFVLLGYWGKYFLSSSFLYYGDILAIMQSNCAEVFEYLSTSLNIATFCFFILNIFALCFFMYYIRKLEFRKVQHIGFLLSLMMLFNLSLVYTCGLNELTVIVPDTVNVWKEYKRFAALKEKREKWLGKALEKLNSNVNNGVYVLVIGESQNRNHMGGYGYEKNNTPWLDDIKGNDGFLLMQSAYSCHTVTVPSLQYALTAKNQYNNMESDEAVSLIEVANAMKIETVWISNQIRYNFYETPLTVIAGAAKQQFWQNESSSKIDNSTKYDLSLTNYFDRIKYTDKMLIVIHLMGNHFQYNERYPKSFELYGNDNDKDRYDNSIAYNDYVMSKIYERVVKINRFKGLIYCSDHSEIPQQGIYHYPSLFRPEMTHIPFYMYFSQDYIEENKDKFAVLKKNRNSVFTNDLLFDLVVSVMGIKHNIFNKAENDISDLRYDSRPERFKTMYGAKGYTEFASKRHE